MKGDDEEREGKGRTFVGLFGFYSISSFVGYLIPNPFLYK